MGQMDRLIFQMNTLTLIMLVGLVIIAILIWICCKLSRRFRKLKKWIDNDKAVKREVARRRRISPKMKTAVLERDNYTCQICGISKGFLNNLCNGLGDYLLLEIDHVNSVANGGSGDDIDNLQVLCWRCNRKKGKAKTNQDVYEQIDYGINRLTLKK